MERFDLLHRRLPPKAGSSAGNVRQGQQKISGCAGTANGREDRQAQAGPP